MPSLARLAPILALALAPHADAAGVTDPNEFPACANLEAPAAWTMQGRSAFGFRLPPGAVEQPRGPSLDHEFAEFRMPDGTLLQYQYGFAVTDISGWVDDPGVTGCRFSLDGVDAALLERVEAGQPRRYAIGLFDFATTYHPEGGDFTGTANALSDDLVVFVQGDDTAASSVARGIAASFRWSKLPLAASGPWTVAGATHNGVFAQWDGRAISVFLATFDRDTRRPDWIGGGEAMPTANAAHVVDGERWLAQPVGFIRVPAGDPPGAAAPIAPGEPSPWGRAELRVREDCAKAELALLENGGRPQVLRLERLLHATGACDRFAR
jgi:hypothetical protein